MKWFTKKSLQQKQKQRAKARKRRRKLQPTRGDVRRRGVQSFCAERGLSAAASARVEHLINHGPTDIDPRDQRQMAPEDRVPRSLEAPSTPPRFWDIEFAK